jgi:uncharacterized protein (TIGR03435 family)
MKFLIYLMVTAAFVQFSVPQAGAVAGINGPKIGDMPPALVLIKTLQGSPAVDLSWEKLKGKVVILEFWATWCAPCIRAIPHLNQLVDQFQGKPVVFISVSSENEGTVEGFLKIHPIKAWIGLDDYDGLNKSFDVKAIPHVVIISMDGHIAAITDPFSLEPQHLEEVLAGKKCSLPEPSVYTLGNQSSADVVSSEEPPLFEVSIREHRLPAKIMGPICMWSQDPDGCGFEGKIATVQSALNFVFDKPDDRIFLDCKLPEGYYDFSLRSPLSQTNILLEQFGAALRATFGLEINQTNRVMDCFVLTQISTNAPGLQRTDKAGGGGRMLGGFKFEAGSMKEVTDYLESALRKPVIGQTGLHGLFQVNMKWDLSEAEQLEARIDRRTWKAYHANPDGDWISSLPQELRADAKLLKAELAKPEEQQFMANPDAIIKAARDRLGLELTPARCSVQVLEVGKS